MTRFYKIRQHEIPYRERSLPVGELAFYLENPRIYSQLAAYGDRSQKNIQAKLQSMEHVKELRSQVDRDGKINEPLLCRPVQADSPLYGQYKYLVLEGNSRLAAIRMEKPDSLPPTEIDCKILDFSNFNEQEVESLIFSLLGEVHIRGKTPWKAYEKAAYIYRRSRNQRVTNQEIAREMGVNESEIAKTINAFQMMVDNEDETTDNWSYYYAYSSIPKLQKHRKNIPDLDECVTSLIKEKKFAKATEMRDHLPVILDNQRARRRLLNKDEDDAFAEALEIAKQSGDTDATFKRLKKFRDDLGSTQTKTQLTNLLKNEASKKKTEFEINKIITTMQQLLKRANRS